MTPSSQASRLTSATVSGAASAVRPSAFRRFLSEVWASYIAHAELRVMLAARQWPLDAKEEARNQIGR
jgi:hypothetical protein